ncbi:MAG: M16 family metallopeptidase [Roseiflexaceae bacterium]
MTTTTVHTLPNGMLVLLREAHSAPVATCWVWYRVGSRNENIGTTGISHWVEHMLFKGTPAIPRGEMDRLIARNGGTFNGFTSNDYTAYFETLPADRIELGLQIESDRMVNSLFDPAEVESERTVIIAEREGHENDPEWWLSEAVMAATFQVHPYRNEVIGWKSDLLALTRDDLYNHYQTYYRPNNAVLVLVGDFDTSAMLGKVEQYFAGLPVGLPLPPFRAAEPEQQGERRVIVRRPGPAHYIEIAYHTPSCRQPDFAPLVVLDAVLSGAKPLSFGGGAQTNRSARIYRALIETQLASHAGSGYRAAYDPHLFELEATVHEKHTAAEVETALITEVEKIQQDSVSADEMAKVLKQVRAQIAYSSESVTSQALLLGMWEVLDSYKRPDTLLEEISAVTADDVQRVAQTYLTEQHRTVGHFFPADDPPAGNGGGRNGNGHGRSARPWAFFYTGGAGGGSAAPALGQPLAAPGQNGAASIEMATRHVLPNGMIALIQRNASSPTVSVRGEVRVGAVNEPAVKSGLATFSGAALIRGTAKRSFQEIVAETEARGASVNAGGGLHSSSFAGRSLAEDLPLILEMLADMLSSPTFPTVEIERLRGQFLMNLRESEQETRIQASRAARELLYPPEHPYSRLSNGTISTVQGITRDDLAIFHQLYHPAATTIAIVGDVDPPAVVAELEQAFGSWEPRSGAPRQDLPAVPPLSEVRRRDIAMAGKIQSDVIWAVHGLRRMDPDYYAVSVANMILGRIGMGGRLGDNVREQQGLAYYCASNVDADLGAGPWAALAGVNPANVERAIAAILHEIAQFCADGPTEEEINDARDFMTGSLVLGLETNDGIAGTLLGIERYRLGADYIARYPAIIRGISAEQMVEAARKYLSTERYVLVVAGPGKE